MLWQKIKLMKLKQTDNQIYNLIKKEEKRQQEKLVLIPSENYASQAVREALGSVLTNKYSEGEPKKRYYPGNEYIDEIELLANKRTLKLFGLSDKRWHVNVKAISAAIANFCVITALLKPGQKIMAMNLPDGGHLSHGWDLPDGRKVTFSSKIFKIIRYKVEKDTQVLDYNKVYKLARRSFSKGKSGLVISGGTAYPREINHRKMAEIAHSVGAYYLADIAHEAGLVAAKVNRSPFPWADVVTMSTQKTLRGPRGSIVICKKELASKIDRAIFPGLQGGPFDNNIAAIAVCLKEALSPKFKIYARQIIRNAKALAMELKKYGFNLVSGGTDKHLILIDLRKFSAKSNFPLRIDGRQAAILLDKAGLVVNKNTVPYETGTPFKPSGIRLGTPAVTTRGMKEKEMKMIAKWIYEVLVEKRNPEDVFKEVRKITNRFKNYDL